MIITLSWLPLTEERRDFRPMLRHLAHQGLTHSAWLEALRQNDLAYILIEVDGHWIARHFHPELGTSERNAIGSAASLWLVEKSEHLSDRRLKISLQNVHIYKHPLRNARIFLEPRQKHTLYLLLDQLDDKKFYILGSLLIFFALFLFVLLFVLPGSVQKTQVASADAPVAAPGLPDQDVQPYPDIRLAQAEARALTWDGSRVEKRTADSGVTDAAPEETGEAVFFAQENWNLPGFQSVGRISDAEKSSFQHSAGYFRLADYAPEAGNDLTSYARRFLEEVTEIAGEVEATLYLRNQRGQVEPCLGLRGELILNGTILEKYRPSPVTINRLKEHHCLLSEDGQRAYFALSDGEKLLGALGLFSREPLYNREDLSRINFLARKYARLLYQALLHEQATTDPESTLKNGIEFQNDLARCLLHRRNFRSPRMLLLLQFSIAAGAEEFRTIGPQLRQVFSPDFELYRIASDAVALIGPALDDERITVRLQELLDSLSHFRGITLAAGSARLDESLDRAQEWFDRARAALEESIAQGADRYTRREAATVAEFIGS